MDKLRPCKCGAMPRERIGEGFPLMICGIPVCTPIGTYLYCPSCGERTNSFVEPIKAYEEWNKKAEGRANMKKKPMEILQEMQSLETKEEMIDYLRQLPRVDEEDAGW